MTKLNTLRRQLGSLRRTRQGVRMISAFSALIVTVLWMLAAVFIVDFAFSLFKVDLSVAQRLIVLCFAGVGVVAGLVWYTVPLLGTKESREEIALLVEREHEIPSDLIAALQFESPDAPTWGSTQLETAVVDYVSRIGSSLHVFKGFPVNQLVRRFVLMTVTIGVLTAFLFAYTAHARVFFNRLGFGAQHYPTRTVIEQVVVNRVPLLVRDGNDTSPSPAKVAEGKPLEFIIQCSGKLAAAGTIELESFGDGPVREVTIDLSRLTLEQRRDRLTDAAGQIRHAIENPGVDIQGPWSQQIATLVRFDARNAVKLLEAAKKDRAELDRVVAIVRKRIESWPGNAQATSLYKGTLNRMVEPVVFQAYLGDAWTDPAVIQMIPLPVIELDVKITPPDYAREGATQYEPTARHLAVLESSQVDFAIHCTNEKELVEAWLIAQSPGGLQKYALEKQDKSGRRWELREDLELPEKIGKLLTDAERVGQPVEEILEAFIPYNPAADLSAVKAKVTKVGEQQKQLSQQCMEFSAATDTYLAELQGNASNQARTASQLFAKTSALIAELAKLESSRQPDGEPQPDGESPAEPSDEITAFVDQITTNVIAAQTAIEQCRDALAQARRISRWFASFQEELRFQIQVTDEDGLHLDSPLSGYIRLKPDRPPSALLSVVHKVVVPTAKPVVEFEVQDDYGIAEVLLHIEVERKRISAEQVDSTAAISITDVWIPVEKLARGAIVEYDGSLMTIEKTQEVPNSPNIRIIARRPSGETTKPEFKTGTALKTRFPLPKGVLPIRGSQLVDLASFRLEKGDRLRLELEVIDYRGKLASESVRSDPLVLEVSDESGVLAAISEPDERTEKQINDSIKLELGIGESP